MKQAYSNVGISELSTVENSLTIDNNIILIDNLDDPFASDDYYMHADDAGLLGRHPSKLRCHMILMCVKGQMSLDVHLDHFTINENDVIMLQEGQIGMSSGIAPGTQMALIGCSDSFFSIDNNVISSVRLQQQILTCPLLHLSKKVMDESVSIYKMMKAKTLETDNRFRRQIMLGYSNVMIYNLLNYVVANNEPDALPPSNLGRQHDLYAKFIKEVQQNYVRERSVMYYANKLCVTPKYLSQVVHNVSGKFASSWIADYVILEAKALLKSRKYTVQEISNNLNFANQSFFGKYFKKRVGCSPLVYQNAE